MPLLRIWHLLSLDAPTLAVSWCLAFAWAAGVAVSPASLMLLGLATWVAYVGDRVLDARLSREPCGLRERHHLYGRLWDERRRLVASGIALAVTLALGCCFFLPRPLVLGYVGLTLASLAYFGVVHGGSAALLRALPKEAVVGLVFAAASSLPSWLAARPVARPGLALAASALALLAWSNCVCIERWENRDATLVRADLSTRLAAQYLPGLLTAGALATASAAMLRPLAALGTIARLAPLLAAGFALLLLLDRLRAHLAVSSLRILADLALLTPLALLLAR